ncbi:MAG: hypothetical protein AAFO58_06930, partial [Pseudomonadota bacterium]
LAATVAMTGAAFAWQNSVVGYDTDGDKMMNRSEFRAMQADDTARFGTYDVNKDGMIDAAEFEAAEFRRYDRNNDEMYDDNEYQRYGEDREVFSKSESKVLAN